MRIAPNFIRPHQAEQPEHLQYGQGEAPISYNIIGDGQVQIFEKSNKGKQVRRQFIEGIERLIDFSLANDTINDVQTAESFATFRDRIDAGSGGYYSTEIGLLYSSGKTALDLICDKVASEKVPLQTRIEKLTTLADGLGVCAPGVVTNLVKTSEELSSTAALQTYVKHLWNEMLDQAILDFSKTKHLTEHYYRGNEIHYVNGYRNYLAQQYGLRERPDNFIPPQITAHLEDCASTVAASVTPNKLVRVLADRFLQELTDRFPEMQGRPLTETEIGNFYAGYSQGIQPTLLQRYGDIDASVVVEEHDSQHHIGDDESYYNLTRSSAMVMHAIAKNLRKNDILSDEQFPLIIESREKSRTRKIKLVGDVLYLKALMRNGEEIRRSLRVSDIDGSLIMSRDIASADPNVILQHLTHWISEQPDQEGASAAIKIFAESNDLLGSAAENGDTELISTILKIGANIEQADNHGATALIRAARSGSTGAITTLVKAGAQIEAQDENGMTSVSHAALNGHISALKILINHGGEIPTDADTQFRLAQIYQGENELRDHTKALHYLYQASDQGHALAQYSLCIEYIKSHGGSRSGTEAAAYFKKSVSGMLALPKGDLAKLFRTIMDLAPRNPSDEHTALMPFIKKAWERFVQLHPSNFDDELGYYVHHIAALPPESVEQELRTLFPEDVVTDSAICRAVVIVKHCLHAFPLEHRLDIVKLLFRMLDERNIAGDYLARYQLAKASLNFPEFSKERRADINIELSKFVPLMNSAGTMKTHESVYDDLLRYAAPDRPRRFIQISNAFFEDQRARSASNRIETFPQNS